MKSINQKIPANQLHSDKNKSHGETNASDRAPMVERLKTQWQNNRSGILKTAAVVTVAAAAVGLTIYFMRKKSMMSMIRNSVVSGGLALSKKLLDTAEVVSHKVADSANAARNNLMDTADIVSHQVADTACNVTGMVKKAVV